MNKNIVSVKNLHKEFPGKIICENETFGIFEGDKIGILGVNGCGKTTFLKMLTQLEFPDSGEIVFRNDIKISYLPQIPELNPQFTIYEQIYFSDEKEFKLLREYHKLSEKLEKNYSAELEKKRQFLIKQIDAADGWDIERKAKSFLNKLGFENLSLKIETLSGGEKRRIDLARVLMNKPDLLILDEPTNHLDIETIEWLQEYLSDYSGTIIFVTHDRYFLDVVSNKIMNMENGKIRFYKGNYSFYLRQKELELTDLQRKETRRTAQLKKEMKWLQRGARARTSKPKNHIERVKELLSKSYLTADNELDISFQTKRMGKTILELHNVGKEFRGKQLFRNFSHIFQKNERIGIIGANGCGKTTLLKLITGEEKPSSGNIKVGKNTHFAYYKQQQENFPKNASILDYIRDFSENIRTEDGNLHSASEMLRKFLFDKKMQQNKISSLSGGEKKRLYLLRSLMFGSNFIILDEPTNDLDIRTLEILEDYLDAFKGCLLIVSHDRFFLDRVVDYLFIFEDNEIIKFPGNYSDYLLVKRFRNEEKKEKRLRKSAVSKPRKKETKKLSFNEKRELDQIEKNISELEERKSELENKIETEAANLSHTEFAEISSELEKIEKNLNKLTERWLELEEKNEN